MNKRVPPPPPGNLILEGGFESCPVPNGTMNDGAINDNCAPPWGAANGTPSICDNTDDLYYDPIIPFEGDQFVCISSTNSNGGIGTCANNEAIFQAVTLCPGVTYRLTFSYYNITYEAGTISVALTNGLVNASTLDNGSPCFLPELANSQTINTTAVPAGDPVWTTVYFEFTPLSATNNQLVFWVNTDAVPSLGFNAGLDAISLLCVDSPVTPFFEVQGACPDYTFNGSTVGQPSVGISSWCWDFGDGTTASGQQVSHTYALSGTYNVCLTVADDCSGCTETVCRTVSCDIVPPPQDFTCPCTAQGTLNVDASELSPFYDATLGGTPYSLLEAAFNYDQNDDGFLDQNDHQGCIAILGRLIMDQDLNISACGNIQMQPCSEIVVGTNTLYPTLALDNNTIFSCERMWRGITVTPHAALTFKGNSIRDAQFSITAQGGSGLGIDPPTRMIAVGNSFSNNHVGVLFPNNAFTTVEHIPFTNNTLNTIVGQSLLPACDANLPNYSSTQGGFAGMVTLGTPLTVGTPGTNGLLNSFSYLRNGIISEGAIVSVHRADFQHVIGTGVAGLPTFATSDGNGVAANGGWTGSQFSEALQFESARRLYERMQVHETMAGFHSTTDSFYNIASSGRIGAYFQAESSAKAIYDYPPGISNGLQQSVAQWESVQTALGGLLTGLANAPTYSDSFLIYQNANALFSSSQTVASNLYGYEKQAAAYRNQGAQSAKSEIDALSADNTLELNRKTIHLLYLQTLGAGVPSLSPEQLAVEEAIALQCPLEGGSAVFAARALYRLNEDRVFMDDSLCLGAQERRQISESTSTVSTVKLAPNPATETVHISGLQASPEKSAVVSLINTSGVVCLERTVAQSETTLDASALPNGLYFCRIWSEGYRTTTLKLVVAH